MRGFRGCGTRPQRELLNVLQNGAFTSITGKTRYIHAIFARKRQRRRQLYARKNRKSADFWHGSADNYSQTKKPGAGKSHKRA